MRCAERGHESYVGKHLSRRVGRGPTVVPMDSPEHRVRELTTYMAECFWPGVTAEDVADAEARVRQATGAVTGDDGLPRCLGSILVPTDEIALFLLEAASIDAATELILQAELPSERILEVAAFGLRQSSLCTGSTRPLNEVQPSSPRR